jgi:hypothetical protein
VEEEIHGRELGQPKLRYLRDVSRKIHPLGGQEHCFLFYSS